MSLGSLLTAFAPPPSCTQSFDHIYATGSAGNSADILIGGPVSIDGCFPSDYKPTRTAFYSPGICPLGYTQAHSTANIITSNIAETTVVCCPTGRSYTFDDAHTALSIESTLACRSSFNSLTTVLTYISDGKTLTTKTSSAGHGGAVNAYGYQVRFQQTDIDHSSPSSPTPTSSPTDTPPGGGGGLSTGAAAGIGTGATIAFLAIVAAAFFIGRRGRQRKRAAPDDNLSGGASTMNEGNMQKLSAAPSYAPATGGTGGYYKPVSTEMSASPAAQELDGYNAPVELDTTQQTMRWNK